MKRFFNEEASVEILEASLFYPIVVIICLILIFYTFIPLVEIYIKKELIEENTYIGDYYEFSNKIYFEGKEDEDLDVYRYIREGEIDNLLENTFNVEISRNIFIEISNKRRLEKNIFFYNRENILNVKSKVIDSDEFVRNIDFINYISDKYLNKEKDDIYEKINKRINKYSFDKNK